MNRVFLIVEGRHPLARQLAGGINAAIIYKQVTGTHRDDPEHFVPVILHQWRSFRLCQCGQQGFQVVVGGQRSHSADAAGELVEWTNPDIRGGNGIALSGVKITDRHALIGVGFQLEIHAVALHL